MDSNILIRWMLRQGRVFEVVRSAMKSLASQHVSLSYTSQNLVEFWNVCTRPASSNGFGLTPKETNLRAQRFEARLELLPDSLAVHHELRRLLVDYNVSGVQVHDAHLAAAMRVHGVKKILTFDRQDFRRFDTVQAIDLRDVH